MQASVINHSICVTHGRKLSRAAPHRDEASCACNCFRAYSFLAFSTYIKVATKDNFLYWVLTFGTAGMGEERSQLGNTNQPPRDSASVWTLVTTLLPSSRR